MSADETAADLLSAALEAFDAANHAWGRCWLYQLRPYRGSAPALDATAVRAAFGDAALSVPAEPTAAAIADFLLAVRAVQEALAPFLATLPAGLANGDILGVSGALAGPL